LERRLVLRADVIPTVTGSAIPTVIARATVIAGGRDGNRLVVIFKPTTRCNIKCLHCYVGDMRNVYTDMSVEGAHQILEKLPVKTEIIFHGGEPSLMGTDFYNRVTQGFEGKFNFSMQTNLTLMDEQWVPLIENTLKRRLSTSFDFGESLRPIEASDWINKINVFKRNGITPYVVSIFWKGNQHMAPGEIFSFFSNLDLSFRLNYVENIGYAVDSGFPALRHDAGRYASCLKSLFDRWFMSPDANIIIDPCCEILTFFLAGSSVTKCPFSSKCYANIISVNPNGDVFPCGGFDSFPGFRYGNLLKQNYSDIFSAPSYIEAGCRRINLPSQCQECPYFHICEGGCRLEAYSYYGDINRETSMCGEYKEIFSHIENRLGEEKGDVSDWLSSLTAKRRTQ